MGIYSFGRFGVLLVDLRQDPAEHTMSTQSPECHTTRPPMEDLLAVPEQVVLILANLDGRATILQSSRQPCLPTTETV